MDPFPDHEPSTSASTIRGLRHIDMALLSSPHVAPQHDDHPDSHSPFRPSSPHSVFHSEPGSPSGDSVSSFPSVGSSFLFSSGPTSPPHPPHHPEDEDEEGLGDSTSGLVIPSLMLPSPSRKPTPYGQMLGNVRLLLLGPKGSDISAMVSQLVDDNEDVVEVGLWEEERSETPPARGKRKATLHVSTDWLEHRDRHGLERIEPARNVELVQLPPYDPYSENQNVVESVLPVIHSPFREVLSILNADLAPSGTLAHLLSSPRSSLYTALVLFATPSLSSAERILVESLSSHIPIIVLQPPSPFHPPPHSRDHTRRASASHLSSFRPSSIEAFREGLFREPSTLATLRMEAASRFLRWREVERAVERVQWSAGASARPEPTATQSPDNHKNVVWDKEAWEAQWEGSLSQEVALHLRRRRSVSGPPRRPSPLSSHSTIGKHSASTWASALNTVDDADEEPEERGMLSPPCAPTPFDPLHLPSLFIFSFSLFGALRTRVARSLGFASTSTPKRSSIADRAVRQQRATPSYTGIRYTFGLGLALVSAFCAGVGIGLVVATRF